MLRGLLLALSLLLTLSPAAQPQVGDGPTRAPHAEGGLLSPAAAVGVSVGVTAAAVLGGLAVEHDNGVRPFLWVLAGAVGPSTGNLVQGEWGDAAKGFGLRAGGAVIVLGAAAGAFWNDSDAQVRALAGVAVVGGLVSLSGVVYDVATAGTNAHARRVTVGPSGAGLALRVGL